MIFDYVDAITILRLRKVCKLFLNVVDKNKWNVIIKPKSGLEYNIINNNIFWMKFSGVDLSNYNVTPNILKSFVHCNNIKIKNISLGKYDYILLSNCTKLDLSESSVENKHLKFLTNCKTLIIKGTTKITLDGLSKLDKHTKIYIDDKVYRELFSCKELFLYKMYDITHHKYEKIEKRIIVEKSPENLTDKISTILTIIVGGVLVYNYIIQIIK